MDQLLVPRMSTVYHCLVEKRRSFLSDFESEKHCHSMWKFQKVELD